MVGRGREAGGMPDMAMPPEGRPWMLMGHLVILTRVGMEGMAVVVVEGDSHMRNRRYRRRCSTRTLMLLCALVSIPIRHRRLMAISDEQGGGGLHGQGEVDLSRQGGKQESSLDDLKKERRGKASRLHRRKRR
jgi:hypothetical protein